jgi:glycine/D-amino acid oxidase-like deaminating enzyme
MMVGKASERAQFDHEHVDFQMEEISISEALDLCPILNPDTVTSTAVRTDGYDIDTHLLMQSYIKSARANGAEINIKSRVTSIEKTAQGWHVKTAIQDYHTKAIVNAAGAWVDQIATLANLAPLGFQPYRRSMARLPAPGGRDVTNWPFMIGTGQSWYAKPDAGKWLVSPEDKDPMDPFDAYADDMVLAEGLARYQDHVIEPVTRLESSWAGLRTFAPDETLVIGRDTHQPSFIWLAGQGGYGFQSGPAASDLLADLLAERTPKIDPKPYAPARFN